MNKTVLLGTAAAVAVAAGLYMVTADQTRVTTANVNFSSSIAEIETSAGDEMGVIETLELEGSEVGVENTQNEGTGTQDFDGLQTEAGEDYSADEMMDDAGEMAEDVAEETGEAMDEAGEMIEEGYEATTEAVEETYEEVEESLEDTIQQKNETSVEDVMDDATDNVEDASDNVEDMADDAADSVEEAADDMEDMADDEMSQ